MPQCWPCRRKIERRLPRLTSWPGPGWTRSRRRPRPAWPVMLPAPSGWLWRGLLNEPMPHCRWTKLLKANRRHLGDMLGDILGNRIAMALAALLLATASLTLGAPVAHAASTTLSPVADSHVQADQPTVNFGNATALRVDGSPVSVAYLKFDVQGLTTPPTRATLK